MKKVEAPRRTHQDASIRKGKQSTHHHHHQSIPSARSQINKETAKAMGEGEGEEAGGKAITRPPPQSFYICTSTFPSASPLSLEAINPETGTNRLDFNGDFSGRKKKKPSPDSVYDGK